MQLAGIEPAQPPWEGGVMTIRPKLHKLIYILQLINFYILALFKGYMVKKSFFREATKAEIIRKRLVETGDLVQLSLDAIAQLGEDEFIIVPAFTPKRYESARKFMKHGPEVKLRRVYTIEQAIKLGRTPVQLRGEAFNSIRGHNFCGYTFLPLGRDRRKRKISLIECLEGARIFAYAHQSGVGIGVRPYADARRVRREGAEVSVEVPSREKGKGRMLFKLVSVPFVDSPEKYAVSLNIGSDHSCPAKRFNIRYRYVDDKEASGIVNLCAHEIAADLELIQQEWQKNKNIIPLQMCQIAIPSQATVDYYLKWENNILVRDDSLKSKERLRKPNRTEKEIGLWAWVEALKHDRTFYSRESRDGDVRAYKWV